jgi:uncharacterized protein
MKKLLSIKLHSCSIIIALFLIAVSTCKSNNPRRSENPGIGYDLVIKDDPIDYKKYIAECDSGKSEACLIVGTAENKEYKNKEFAQIWFVKACNLGNSNGCILAANYEMAKGNETLAKDLFMKACGLGQAQGCERLKEIRYKNSNGKKPPPGRSYDEIIDFSRPKYRLKWRKECNAGKPEGCIGVGFSYMPNNEEAAQKWYLRACDMGNGGGCGLAANYEMAKGKKELAKHLYRKACDLGDTLGCTSLEQMK